MRKQVGFLRCPGSSQKRPDVPHIVLPAVLHPDLSGPCLTGT